MLYKMKKIGKHFLYVLFSNILYGLLLYHVFSWLAGYSLLYAFFGNLALIMLGLAIDEFTLKMTQSKWLIVQLKKEKDLGKSFRTYQLWLDNFVSFKTSLYLFYIIILLVSQIIAFNPTLVGESLGYFLQANEYSILFLIAFDMLVRQFAKDRARLEKTADKLKKELFEKAGE